MFFEIEQKHLDSNITLLTAMETQTATGLGGKKSSWDKSFWVISVELFY